MDIAFENVTVLRHPGQGEPVANSSAAGARWIIKPHICLMREASGPAEDDDVLIAHHDHGPKFIVVRARPLAQLFLETAQDLWDANLSGALRLKVKPVTGSLNGPSLNLTFEFRGKTALLVAPLDPQPRKMTA